MNTHEDELTDVREAQLSASHIGVVRRPEAVTDAAPGLVVADLHTSLILVRSVHQTQLAVIAQNCKGVRYSMAIVLGNLSELFTVTEAK